MRHPSWLCNYSLTNETPSWHHLRSKICVNHCLLIVHCVYMRIWGSYIRCSNTGAVWLWWCSWLGHTHTLTHYLARHSPTQDGRGHKLSEITNNSMAWLLHKSLPSCPLQVKLKLYFCFAASVYSYCFMLPGSWWQTAISFFCLSFGSDLILQSRCWRKLKWFHDFYRL